MPKRKVSLSPMKTRIVLLYARGMDEAEIAVALRSTTGAVRNHLWRARKLMSAKHNGQLCAMVALAHERMKAENSAK